MKNEYTDLYFNTYGFDHNFRGVGRMSEFFESAFLSLVLTGVFFMVLALGGMVINYIIGIFQDGKEQAARIKRYEKMNKEYNGHN